jgi:hypothetical protein
LKYVYQDRTVVPVTRAVETPKMDIFTNADVICFHFVFGYSDLNSLAALRECQHRYKERRLRFRRVLSRVHRNLSETILLCCMDVLSVEDAIRGMKRLRCISFD